MKNFFIVFIAGSILCCSACFMDLPGATTEKKTILSHDQLFTLDTLTIYNPTRSQCDADPLITASNKRIDEDKLLAGTVRWIALSRDLLSRWGGAFHYGDTLLVDAGDPEINGIWIVQDTMNKRFHKRGDLLFHARSRSIGRWHNVSITRRNFYYQRHDYRSFSDEIVTTNRY